MPTTQMGILVVLGAITTLCSFSGALILFSCWLEIRNARKDILHAGIDIHTALIEANIQQRLAIMGTAPKDSAPSELGFHRPTFMDGATGETPQQWLDRMREEHSARAGLPRP